MRFMIKVSAPAEPLSTMIQNGTVEETVGKALALNPEAAYFFLENGERAALYVYDIADASDIPKYVEHHIRDMNAKVDTIPVMTPDDLQAGLSKLNS